jgi:HK97 gp10 family phage protein
MPRTKKAGAAPGNISVEVVYDFTEKVGLNTKVRANDIVTKTVFDIEGQAKMNATGRPGPNVITGTNRAAIRGVIDAGGTSGRVVAGAEYAIHLEYGTHKMPAYPFFIPAVEMHRPIFLEAMRSINPYA